MVRDEVLRPLAAQAPPVYVVWVPILDGDQASVAASAAVTFADRRMRHYYDAAGQLPGPLGQLLKLPPRTADDPTSGLAWDVYLLYPPGIIWNPHAPPPLPVRWMHQLSRVPESLAPSLDGPQLRRWIEDSAGEIGAPSITEQCADP